MEIIIGYLLGAFVIVLLFISLFKMLSSRMKNSITETNERITNLEKRIEDVENK